MQKQANTHSVAVGYLLWIFGFMGAHRFYYGKWLSGIIWALTLGLFFIGWIVDLFLIPAMDREADGRFTPGRIDYSLAWICLLFFWLGLFGIHRFYQGKIWTGLLFLFTGGLFGIGFIYDVLTLNTQIDEQNRTGA